MCEVIQIFLEACPTLGLLSLLFSVMDCECRGFVPKYLPFLPFCDWEFSFSFRSGEVFLLIVEWPPVFENLESVQILRTSFLILSLQAIAVLFSPLLPMR